MFSMYENSYIILGDTRFRGCFYPSIDKAKEACSTWKDNGITLSFKRSVSWEEIGLEPKRGLKPKPINEVISSRKCVVNVVDRKIEGLKNNEIRSQRWEQGKNEGRWKLVREFRY